MQPIRNDILDPKLKGHLDFDSASNGWTVHLLHEHKAADVSWRRMYLTQPPLTGIFIIYGSDHAEGTSFLTNEKGIKAGELADEIFDLATRLGSHTISVKKIILNGAARDRASAEKWFSTNRKVENLGPAPLEGLRKQIKSNASVLFPKALEEYGKKNGGFSAKQAFEVIVVRGRFDGPDSPLQYQAILMTGPPTSRTDAANATAHDTMDGALQTLADLTGEALFKKSTEGEGDMTEDEVEETEAFESGWLIKGIS
ncbi:hypothetical protein HII31_06186 [Pseudocercospora fuligena]|uniref:Uncharacterized protein n=1 Tax=Pseudocercospora fuligena TaxID=685502 RepID=A0A8H6RK41_9PEZI|nr:hypothetical protein HII31_06186 [Pseudocercospora fuligena]